MFPIQERQAGPLVEYLPELVPDRTGLSSRLSVHVLSGKSGGEVHHDQVIT